MKDSEVSVAGVVQWRHTLVGAIALSVALCAAPSAASSTIKNDAGAPGFLVELEPHAVLTPFSPPNGGAGGGLGAGMLVGINLAPRGFIPSINDSVSLGIGLDWVQYLTNTTSSGECAEWIGTGDEAICIRVKGGAGAGSYFFAPAVMQWNFYLTKQWSVFGEPGLALYLWSANSDPGVHANLTPVFNVGGRWHFSKKAHLVLRAGYPYTTVGFSFYL